MKKLIILGLLALPLGACSATLAADLSPVASAASTVLCKDLTKTASADTQCTTITGDVITLGTAVAAGLLLP